MATPHPSPDGHGRRSHAARLVGATVNVAAVAAVVAAPLAAITLWLLLTDPATAADIFERGDLMPALSAIARTMGRALMFVLAYL